MKRLSVVFEDADYAILLKAKGKRTWYDVLLEWARRDLEEAEASE